MIIAANRKLIIINIEIKQNKNNYSKKIRGYEEIIAKNKVDINKKQHKDINNKQIKNSIQIEYDI